MICDEIRRFNLRFLSIGLATEGPYDPKTWVQYGAPWGNQIKAYAEYGNFRWPHAHYEDNAGKLVRQRIRLQPYA